MKRKKVKYGFDYNGRKVRIYSKKEMVREISKNQDVVFHKDGWIISHSAGH